MSIVPNTDLELSDIAAYGVPGGIDGEGYTGMHEVLLLKKSLDMVRDVIATFRQHVKELRSSTALTAEGQDQQIGVTANEQLGRLNFAAELKQAKAKRDTLRDALEKARRGVIATDDSTAGQTLAKLDQIVRLLLEQEIRQALRKRDAIYRPQDLFEAIERGDSHFVGAVFNAPDIVQKELVDDPEKLQMAQEQWAERTDPERAREITDLSKAIEVLQTAIKNATKIIASAAGLEQRDAFVVIETGEVVEA